MSERGAPYASVIVPTHDRASTLPTAIASIQRQTVRNIEIVIVGDGVTPQVREIAAALAANDERIVFCDWPKAPNRGGSHRDRAVRAACAERIFYSDDDDILLPDHVERLGSVLDECDCADSPAASVTLSGQIQVSLPNHRRGPVRDALADGIVRVTFDTHFAHRKATYERIGPLWTDVEQGITAKFLQGFARVPWVTWRTLSCVTALSFHGAARRYMSASDRAAEHLRYSEDVLQHRMSACTTSAHYDWYAFLLANALRLPVEGMEAFFKRCHIGLDADQSAVDVGFSLSEEQVHSVRNVFALLNGTPIDRDFLAPLVVRLMDPLVGLRPRHTLLARLLAESIGVETAVEILEAYRPADASALELRDFLLVRLLISGGRFDDASARLEALLASHSCRPAVAYALAADLARRRNDGETTLRHASRSLQLDPHLPEAHEPMVWALAKLGRFDEAQHAVAMAGQTFTDDRFTRRLGELAVPPTRM
jgi:glycosyltransferase involved in cell wall biosynthesis